MTIYKATPCPCGCCKDWHVSPIADVQGVGFSQRQAEAVADLLNWASANPEVSASSMIASLVFSDEPIGKGEWE